MLDSGNFITSSSVFWLVWVTPILIFISVFGSNMTLETKRAYVLVFRGEMKDFLRILYSTAHPGLVEVGG